ncbi:MAG: hypothetical protein HOH19_02615 [Kordiimonadaceae bacterium]|jgi:hypothetical protein|nr:hypothetical protein [Kordiimonadaceae bacterium]
MEERDWITLIGGGFGHMTAPFAGHKTDQKKADKYARLAGKEGLNINDAVKHAKQYLKLRDVSGAALQEELERVEYYFKGTELDR